MVDKPKAAGQGPVIKLSRLDNIPLQAPKGGKGKVDPHAAHNASRDAHGKLKAKGLMDKPNVGGNLGLSHPETDKSGQYPPVEFINTETGQKVRLPGKRQMTYVEYSRKVAGVPADAIRKQLKSGESLVKVGNNVFVLRNASSDDIQAIGGERLPRETLR